MPTIVEVVNEMNEAGVPEVVARNSAAQFGTRDRSYLGATLMPERTVMVNMYREEAIRFRTVIAADGTRYSRVQRRGNDLFASFEVELGNSDIGADMSAQQYETLMRYLDSNQSDNAIRAATRWMDVRVLRALVENAERQRWEALLFGKVWRVGDDNYRDLVEYANPPFHRLSPAKAWTDPTTDIFEDIHTAVQTLIDKGYRPGRIITSRRIVNIMARNNTVKMRGGITVVNGGTIATASGRASLSDINALLSDDGLPPIETYDLQYRTQAGSFRFLPENAMLIVATVERDDDLDMGDANVEDLIPFELRGTQVGYHAIGKATGQPTPGRVINLFAYTNKPPRVEAEGYMCHLPVVQFAEAMVSILGIQ